MKKTSAGGTRRINILVANNGFFIFFLTIKFYLKMKVNNYMTVNQNDNPGQIENFFKRHLYFFLDSVIFVVASLLFLKFSMLPFQIYQSFGHGYFRCFFGYYATNLIFDFIILGSVKTCYQIWKLGFPNFKPFYSKF